MILSSLLDFSDCDLPEEVVKQVKDWILQYDHIFALDKGDLQRTDLLHRQPCTHLTAAKEGNILPKAKDSMVQKMLAQGLIRLSSSQRLCPVVLVKKRAGSYWFCIETRRCTSV